MSASAVNERLRRVHPSIGDVGACLIGPIRPELAGIGHTKSDDANWPRKKVRIGFNKR